MTLYRRGSDGQPAGDGLTLTMDARGQLTGPAGTPIAGLLFGALPVGAADAGVQLAPDLDITLAGQQAPIGYSFEVRTAEESSLIATLQAQGKGVQEIQSALDNLRGDKGGVTDLGFPRTVTGQVIPTPKDGVVGGLPTGIPRDESKGDSATKLSAKRENESAVILAAFGYRVEQTPTPRKSDYIKEGKEPDFRISENIFDVYSPKTNKIDGLRDQMSSKVKDKQTYRLVVNLSDSIFTVNDIKNILIHKPISKLSKVIVIGMNQQVTRLFPN